MATIASQSISLGSLVNPTYSACAAGGDKFNNTGREFIHVNNGSAGSLRVLADSVTACNQGFDHDITLTLPAGQSGFIGPFDTGRFNDANGQVALSYPDGVSTLTMAVLKY